MKDKTRFPDPAYKDAVLAPLFEGAKAHYVAPVRSINRAHLVMLNEVGILTRKQAGAIALALVDIDENLDMEALRYTGEVEDYFFLVEAELKKRLGPDLAGALHTARSRNDMDHTVFKLVLQQKLDALLALAHGLARAVIDKADAEKQTLIVAYTHGQPAQPSTFGHYLGAMIEVLLGDLKRLHAAREALQECPMGAAAITTTGFNIDRFRIAELLGFTGVKQNSYGAIAAIDYVTSLYSALKLLFLHLGRVIQDFQFWSSFEAGQLYVPNSLVQISSIMPQKRNPVPIEHLRLLSSLSVGRCDTVVNTMHNTPFTDMNDSEGEVQQSGYGALESGARVLTLLSAFIPALDIRADRVAANIDKSCICVTELADVLVRTENISFRQAHAIAAKTTSGVLSRSEPLAMGFADFAAAFEAQAGRTSAMDEESFAKAVSPQNFIEVRNLFGGPALVPMEKALASYRQALEGLEGLAKENTSRKNKAEKMLNSAFLRLNDNKGEG